MLDRKRRREAKAAARSATPRCSRRGRKRPAGPVIDLPPFGRVRLVDEVDCGAAEPGPPVSRKPRRGEPRRDDPGPALPRAARRPTAKASYMAFRLGRWKLLKPGAAYVLAVDYPEDQPRSVLVMNGGNETSRGFHTGTHARRRAASEVRQQQSRVAARAALRPVRDLDALLQPARPLPRPGVHPRRRRTAKLTAEDGFDVVIAQFSARERSRPRAAPPWRASGCSRSPDEAGAWPSRCACRPRRCRGGTSSGARRWPTA